MKPMIRLTLLTLVLLPALVLSDTNVVEGRWLTQEKNIQGPKPEKASG